MEIKQLQCFIAVAEEKHFNRAAMRLNMTQPPLSRQIQMLERDMACTLFIRTSRSVEITEAGKSFLSDARRILSLLESSRNTAKNISLGQSGVLRCGFTAASAYYYLPKLIRRMKVDIPDGALDLKEMVSARQIEALETGEIDVGLLRFPTDTKIYQERLVVREKMILAIPADHPLSNVEVARWQDLKGVDFIMYDRVEGRYLHDLISVKFDQFRIKPNIVQRLAQIHSMLLLVRAGVGLSIVPESARILKIDGVEYREFSGQSTPEAELLIVWRETNPNPLIPVVVKIAESLLTDD